MNQFYKTTKKFTLLLLLIPLVFTWNCPANDGPRTKITKVEYISSEIGEGSFTTEGEFSVNYSPERTFYETYTIDIDGATITQYTGGEGPGIEVVWKTNDANTTGFSCGVSHEYYVVIIKQDNITLAASEYSIFHLAGNNYGYAELPLNFTDQTYATAETHTYKFEFWQCKSSCDLKDYGKKTKKKEEFTITVEYTP
ncbi:MAG: hypothetical protein ABUK01_10695 [Leptospirales bacterium]